VLPEELIPEISTRMGHVARLCRAIWQRSRLAAAGMGTLLGQA
jgi:hypothetical protein